MTIRVYPSVLPGDPIEVYDADGITIEQWLAETVIGYERRDEPPITVTVNGSIVPAERWESTVLRDNDAVDIRPQPKEPVTIIAAVVAVVAAAASFLLRPKIPSPGNKGERGSKLGAVSAEGNKARLGEVIPELAGRHKRYPDYLTQARRLFSGPKEQQLQMLLCIGRGEFDIDPGSVLLGNTPIDELPKASYQVFEPGDLVSGHVAHQNWYNAPEVGQSVGGSGLRLRSERDISNSWGEALTLSGNTLEGNNPPSGWSAGTQINLSFDHELTIGESGGESTFEFNIRYLRVEGALPIEIIGVPGFSERTLRLKTGNNGVYTLQEYSFGNWQTVTAAPPGTYTVEVYESGKTSALFKITDVSSVVEVVPFRGGIEQSGWGGFPASSGTGTATLSSGQTGGIWSLPFAACPAGETTSYIEFDVFAPKGLGYVNDNGDLEPRQRTIELRYRPMGTDSAWTTISRGIAGRTRDQIGMTRSVSLGSAMRPEVQIRRTSSEDNDTRAMDRLEWYGLRSRLTAKTRYPGLTVIAVTVTGSDAIASQTENKISLVATRKLPTLNSGGTWSAPQATRSIAAWMAHIATTAGYTYDDLDTDEIIRLDAKWGQRGDVFDFIETEESTVKESLNRCLRAGMAEVSIEAGKLRPVRDEPRSTFEQMYTPQNMLEPLSRSVEAPRPDDPDGVDVEFVSSDTWSKETVECRLPGDAGVRAEKVTLDGVTGRTRAWRIGMRRRRELKYRRWSYSFSTELDALNSNYMSYCALSDDVPGYGQSAELTRSSKPDASTVVLDVSEPMEWANGEDHLVAWRLLDGGLAGPYPANRGADDYQIIAETARINPYYGDEMERSHVLFGTAERWCHPVLITNINPQGFESVSVKAIGYDERIYADDNNAP